MTMPHRVAAAYQPPATVRGPVTALRWLAGVSADDSPGEAEDKFLAARWAAGAGARPTAQDAARLAKASAEGRLPRRRISR